MSSLERGPGKKRGWSLSAAKDLVGVFTRDRWAVCVCESYAQREPEKLRREKLQCPSACWDIAQGSEGS